MPTVAFVIALGLVATNEAVHWTSQFPAARLMLVRLIEVALVSAKAEPVTGAGCSPTLPA